MKAIATILLLAMTGAALAEPSKPADQAATTYKDGKPFMYDRLDMRRRVPTGFRSDAPEASPNTAQDKPAPEKAPAPKKSPG